MLVKRLRLDHQKQGSAERSTGRQASRLCRKTAARSGSNWLPASCTLKTVHPLQGRDSHYFFSANL